ncbi:MAG: thioredoxin, partial [Pseudomonadota bacterium]|nr:thioredoxin [Pseudomonadota bacterium]
MKGTSMDTISPTPDAGNAATILNVTTESFMADVIEASATQLVLLDLWAPWCGPCKQLTPLLEQVTAQANGAVRLAKMNIDEHPAVAQQLQVQSIPAVFAFKNGQPVDGFMGALPESQIREFVTRHLDDELAASPVEEMIAIAARAMDQGDMAAAAQAYGQVLEQDPTHGGAIAGIAQAHFAAGNIDQAEQTLAMAPEISLDPEIAAARATLALAAKSDALGDDTGALVEALAADPNN